MISNEEKKEFVRTIFDRIPVEASSEEAQREIMKILMADTYNGKLYKYRAVNDYAIQNLKNGTLFCAVPSSFNDPFDCKIGLDIPSFVVAQYEGLIVKGCQYFCRFEEKYDCEENWKNCLEEEKILFHYWKSNSKIEQFIKNYATLNLSIDEQKELIWNHFDVLIDIIKGFLLVDTLKAQTEEILTVFENCKKELPLMKDKQIALGKVKMEEIVKKQGIEMDADEITLLSLIYQLQRPNDIETAYYMDKDLEEINKKLSEDMDREFCVGSLCNDYKNKLMWSHYAEGHKGFCIEYDFGNGLRELESGLILPVIYSEERVKYPWSVLFMDNKDNETTNLVGAYAKILTLVSKDEMWSYEKEWRIIVPGQGGGKNVKMPSISCIYLGALCSDKDCKTIINIAKEIGVPVKKMVIGRSKYSLHAQEISN